MMRVPKPRKRNPKGSFRLSERDLQILILIWLCDGIMSRRQLEQQFFAGKDKSQARRRFRELYDRVYLNQPHNERQCANAPEHIYWLDKRGYEEVARALNIEPNRNLKKIRTFNPMILRHHLEIVDIRLKVMADVKQIASLLMSRWVTERQFRSWRHSISYDNAVGETVEKGVEPDGFFAVGLRNRDANKMVFYSFTLERDRGTEDLERIRDKLLANAAYLDSDAYHKALGVKTGRCLMVTTGWERAENMMALAQELKVAWAWYFCTLEDLLDSQSNVMVDSIWRVANKSQSVSLIPAHLMVEEPHTVEESSSSQNGRSRERDDVS
jgi:hypothetical protein